MRRAINDTVDAQGKATRTEITSTYDGKEYELKGAAMPTTRAYTRIDGGYEFVTRVNGKVTTTTRVVHAPDGKTRTITTTGTNEQGQKVNNVVVWNKQ
jgi:hypothetical protein